MVGSMVRSALKVAKQGQDEGRKRVAMLPVL